MVEKYTLTGALPLQIRASFVFPARLETKKSCPAALTTGQLFHFLFFRKERVIRRLFPRRR